MQAPSIPSETLQVLHPSFQTAQFHGISTLTLIQLPLTSISPLEDGEYQFKIGIKLEKECDDSVFYEVMINNSILRFKDKFFKLLTDDIAGSVSGANLEGDSFFNETKDLSLTDFFNSDDIVFQETPMSP